MTELLRASELYPNMIPIIPILPLRELTSDIELEEKEWELICYYPEIFQETSNSHHTSIDKKASTVYSSIGVLSG